MSTPASRPVAVLVVGCAGVAVFLAVRQLVGGMLDGPGMLVGCAVGATLSTWFCFAGDRPRFAGIGSSAAAIVWGTYAAIATGRCIEEAVRDREVGFGLIGSALWIMLCATVITGWWVFPGVMLVLRRLRRWP